MLSHLARLLLDELRPTARVVLRRVGRRVVRVGMWLQECPKTGRRGYP